MASENKNVGSNSEQHLDGKQGQRNQASGGKRSRRRGGRGGRGKAGSGGPRDPNIDPDAIPPSRRQVAPQADQKIGSVAGASVPAHGLTITAVNSLLEKSFPSTPVSAQPFQFAYVNPNRFVELGIEVYRHMRTLDHHLEKYCSEREFLIYLGWVLVKRVFSQLPFGRDEALSTFVDQIGEHMLPAPIEEYLSHLTPSMAASGVVIYPSLIIPGQHAAGNWNDTSTLPVRLDNMEAANVALFPIMYPFWYLWRSMLSQAALQIDGHNVILRQKDQANAVAGNDAYLANNHAATAANACRPEHADRQFTQARLNEMTPDGYNGAMFYDHEITRAYVYLTERLKTKYSFRPFPSDKKDSSRALLGWCEPNTPGAAATARPRSYSVYSHGEFTKYEYYAIQLYQYRRLFPAAVGRVNNNQQNQILAVTPASVTPPAGCEYTSAQDDQGFLSMYVMAYTIERQIR